MNVIDVTVQWQLQRSLFTDHLTVTLKPLPHHLPQHILENSAVLVVLNLVWRIDPHDGLEFCLLPILAARANLHGHSRRDAAGNTLDIENLEARQAQARRAFTVLEL